jgi:hypothetical protein
MPVAPGCVGWRSRQARRPARSRIGVARARFRRLAELQPRGHHGCDARRRLQRHARRGGLLHAVPDAALVRHALAGLREQGFAPRQRGDADRGLAAGEGRVGARREQFHGEGIAGPIGTPASRASASPAGSRAAAAGFRPAPCAPPPPPTELGTSSASAARARSEFARPEPGLRRRHQRQRRVSRRGPPRRRAARPPRRPASRGRLEAARWRRCGTRTRPAGRARAGRACSRPQQRDIAAMSSRNCAVRGGSCSMRGVSGSGVSGGRAIIVAKTPGTLWIVATPIGNLEDLSPRAQRILGEVTS